MRYIIFAAICLNLAFLKAQEIEIPKEQYPFSEIFEWKGMGGILLNKDPRGVLKKKNLTLVNTEKTRVWQQSFNPNGEVSYLINQENARYIYFLDNLNLEDGRYSFHQLNSAGSVNSSTTNLMSVIRKLEGIEIGNLELQEVVTTDKALVHVFLHHDKKAGKYSEIAVFMTHHNLMNYAVVLGEVSEDDRSKRVFGGTQYIGSTGDKIYFTRNRFKDPKNGWVILEYTSKGELKGEQNIPRPPGTFAVHERVGFGMCGSYYLNTSFGEEAGALYHHNGKLYFSGIENKGKTLLNVYEFVPTSRQWILVSGGEWKLPESKKPAKMGIQVLNEGVGHYLTGSEKKIDFRYFSADHPAVLNTFADQLIFNPSAMLFQVQKNDFVCLLNGVTLHFDRSQLGKAENVKFEIQKQ